MSCVLCGCFVFCRLARDTTESTSCNLRVDITHIWVNIQLQIFGATRKTIITQTVLILIIVTFQNEIWALPLREQVALLQKR